MFKYRIHLPAPCSEKCPPRGPTCNWRKRRKRGRREGGCVGRGSLTTEEGEERLRGARLEKEEEEEEGTVLLLLHGMCVGTGGRREKTRRKEKRQWALGTNQEGFFPLFRVPTR